MRKLRYMVVDDDTTNNMICEFNIKRFDIDAEIKIFVEPEHALSVIEEEYSTSSENVPTVLFLDVNMPSMTGWEFLDVFLKFELKVRNQFIIYILSSSIEDFAEKAKKYTFIKGFLSKPLKITDLEEVRNVIIASQNNC